MDRNLYEMKAYVLGIFDIESLSTAELMHEVDYASTNIIARKNFDMDRRKDMVVGISRIINHDPLYKPA